MKHSLGLSLVFCLVCMNTLSADTIKLKDGIEYEGKVVAETPKSIKLEVDLFGQKEIVTIPKRNIAVHIRGTVPQDTVKPREPEKTEPPKQGEKAGEEKKADPRAPASPPGGAQKEKAYYFEIPIKGVIGKEVVAAKLEEALKIGLKREGTILVLSVDSPGGLVSETEKIIGLLSKHKKVRSIAYIKKALSAAAIISLTCDEIYMHKDAHIGAATAIQVQGGEYTAVDEKFQSVWRSVGRHAAEIGGHSPLLAEAMIDKRMQLRLRMDGGKKIIERYDTMDWKDFDQGDIVTEKEKLLTLTAREAHKIGLSSGICTGVPGIGKVAAGLADWRSSSSRGRSIMEKYAKDIKWAEHRLELKCNDLEKSLKLAAKNSPLEQTYYVDERGRFTARSRAKWQAYSKRCFDYLGEAERTMKAIAKLMEDYPSFQNEVKTINDAKDEIRDLRKKIRDDANRRGV